MKNSKLKSDYHVFLIVIFLIGGFLITSCATSKPRLTKSNGGIKPVRLVSRQYGGEKVVVSYKKPVTELKVQVGQVEPKETIESKKAEIGQKRQIKVTQERKLEGEKPEVLKTEKTKITETKSYPGLKEKDNLVTLDFKDEKFCNVLKVFSYITGKNVIAPDKLSDKEISIYLKDVSPKSAIEAICAKYNLWYEENEDYIRLRDIGGYGKIVMSKGKIKELRFEGQELNDVLSVISDITGQNVICNENIAKKKVTLHLEDIPVKVAIEVICKKYELWYRNNGDYIRLVSAEDYGRDTPVDYRIKTRVFNLKYASAPQVADTIGCVMGERVDYNLPANLESYIHIKMPDIKKEHAEPVQAEETTEVAKEIKIPEYEKQLTSQKIQELMEKKLKLELTSEDIRWIDKKLGFAIMSIFIRNNSILVCSADDRILDEIQELIEKLDIPTPQVLLECKILRFRLTDEFTSFFDLLDFRLRRGKGIYVIPEMRGLWEYFHATAPELYPEGVPLVEGEPMKHGAGFKAQMQLLKEKGLIQTIATPTITAAQNSEAEIYSGKVNIPLFRDVEVIPPTVTEGVAIPGYTSPVYESVSVGIRLKITPQINEDKSVTLRIYVEESGISKREAEILYVPEPGKPWEHTYVDVKSEETTETIVVVPEGHTLAIGGLTREEDRVVEKKTPFLGDLPLIGFLFKDHKTEKVKTELVFLIRPHIVMTPKEAEKVTKEALKTIEHPYIKEGREKLFEKKGTKLKRVTAPDKEKENK